MPLEEKLHRRGINLKRPIASHFSLSEFYQWSEALRAASHDVKSCLEAISKIDPSIAEIPEISEQHCLTEGDIGEVKQELTHLAVFSDELRAEQGGYDRVRSICKDLAFDFDRPIVTEPAIGTDDWRMFGRYLLRRGEFGTALGICARCNFDVLAEDLRLDFDAYCKKLDEERFRAIQEFLSYLTLGQLEDLANHCPHANAIIALWQLGVAARMAAQDATVAYSYWNAFPLRDLLNHPGESESAALASALHRFCVDDDEVKPRWVDIQRILRKAQAQPVAEGADYISAWKRDLLEILEPYRGGGVTYMQLWAEASRDICEPIRAAVNASDFEKAYHLCQQLHTDFDFSTHFQRWRMVIPERQRKKSEYEKKIRHLTYSLLDDLGQWANEYQQARSVSDKSHRHSASSDLLDVTRDAWRCGQPDAPPLKLWLDFSVVERDHPFAVVPSIREGTGRDLVATSYLCDPQTLVRIPRVFKRTFDGLSDVQAVDYLSDKLCHVLNPITDVDLAYAFVDKGMLEAYSALSVVSNEEFPATLDRRVADECDHRTRDINKRIEQLRFRIDKLTTTDVELAHDALSDAAELLSHEAWDEVDRRLREVDEIVPCLEDEFQRACEIKELGREVADLGGNPGDITDLKLLRRIRDQLKAELKPKRKHLETLQAITETEDKESLLKQAFDNAIKHLGCSTSLPKGPEDADLLKIALDEALVPLAEELKRRHHYQDEHKRALEHLAQVICRRLCECTAQLTLEDKFIAEIGKSASSWAILDKGLPVIEKLMGILGPATAESPHSGTSGNVQVDQGNEYQWLARKLASGQGPIKDSSQGYVELVSYVDAGNWSQALEVSRQVLKGLKDTTTSLYADWTVNAIVVQLLGRPELLPEEELAASLNAIATNPSHALVRRFSPTKNTRGPIGDIIGNYLLRLAKTLGMEEQGETVADAVLWLSRNPQATLTRARLFRLAFDDSAARDSVTTKILWDYHAGESRQAEIRGALMNILWRCSATPALACCLTYAPNDIPAKVAERLSVVAQQALDTGRMDLVQSLIDLRKRHTARPYHFFVEHVLTQFSAASTPQTKVSLLGPLSKRIGNDLYQGIVKVEPRLIDSPYSVTIILPNNGVLRFASGRLSETLTGPFIGSDSEVHVEFQLLRSDASRFALEARCEAVSITNAKEEFRIELDVSVWGSSDFEGPTGDEIEEAFSGFPYHHVRGDDFVPRPSDERKVEKLLFAGRAVRSFWIASPRRSGKTSMLFRILDEYSHKNGKDNAIIFLTMDETFDSSRGFNKWVWNRLRSNRANSQLCDLLGDRLDDIGKTLPFDTDSGTFLTTLGRQLINAECGSRVIYLLDEVDKLASMYFSGGTRREAASQLLWQIRNNLTAEQRDIGIVFAGSSAAKELFVNRQDAPFYNSLHLLELTPFSCDTKEAELNTRAIVEPPRIKGRIAFGSDSLKHLVWLCAGIPYYMKLLAGSVYATVRQPVVLISDVSEGLKALLERRTGVTDLDSTGGAAATDELSILDSDDITSKVIADAVLYTVAELASPLSGRTLWRGRIYAEDSPLVSRYGLSRKLIEEGIERCISLGLLLRNEESGAQAIGFATPILGESIRHNKGKFWANVSHQLDMLKAVGE